MLSAIAIAAVTATLPFDGAIEDDGNDYVIIDFEVPAGTREIEISHTNGSDQNILDWGVWDPDGFRGWGGGLTENAVIGATEASRGYLAGELPAGTWHLVIGKARIREWPAPYSVTIDLKDAETLPARERAPFAVAVLETGRRWYAGDFHVHSRESGDATATFQEIADLARQRGLDFIALSDHNTTSQHALMAAYQAGETDVLLLRSAEITTYAGHGNGLGISTYVDHRVGHQGVSGRAIIEDVVAQGGLFSINHPALDLGELCIGCAWEHEDTPWEQVSAMEIHTGDWDATISLFTPRAIALWDEKLDQGYRITAIGGSDDHRAGVDLSNTQSPIGSPTTLVLADELSEAAIADGVRQGRALVKLRGPDDPDLSLSAVGADGRAVDIGDTTAGARVTLTIGVTRGAGQDLGVLIVRNGQAVDLLPIDADDFQATVDYDVRPEGDRFRAQVVLGGTLPVVVSNHIYVDYLEPADPGGCACRTTALGARSWTGAALIGLLLALGIRLPRRRSRTRRS